MVCIDIFLTLGQHIDWLIDIVRNRVLGIQMVIINFHKTIVTCFFHV